MTTAICCSVSPDHEGLSVFCVSLNILLSTGELTSPFIQQHGKPVSGISLFTCSIANSKLFIIANSKLFIIKKTQGCPNG